MPINLRYRLSLMSDAQLVAKLDENLAYLTEKKILLDKKQGWFLSMFSPHTMQRTFVRHRLAYRAKATLVGLFDVQADPPWLILFTPFFFWFLGRNAREELKRPYSLYLLRCEIEDLQDELYKRIKNRN